MPRSRATCSTVVNCARPSIAARTMLCGFVEPRLFVRMSLMPTHSMTARTAPPAITPAPGAAGFIQTLPAPCRPVTSCGIVEPVSGTCTRLRRAATTATGRARATLFGAWRAFRIRSLHLELQPAFAGSIGHRFHAAVILVPATVENHLRDSLLLGDRRDLLADLERLLRLLPFA